MIYKHFILTRFNIPFVKEYGNEFLLAKDYLDKRFDIFYRFCVQSIINQSNKNFTWFILFDANTPNRYKEKNQDLFCSFPNIIPIYINIQELKNQKNLEFYLQEVHSIISKNNNNVNELGINYEDFFSRVLLPNFLNNLILQNIDSDTKYIITTRIDNDDCFETDMIKFIQQQATDAHIDKILNFDNGLQYIADKNICQTYYYPNNHFISIIEPINLPIKTILYWNHFFIDRYKEIIHINTKPLWIEVIHNNNAQNTLKLSKKDHLLWNADLYPFGLNKQWNSIVTFVSLLFYPKVYFWPHIKKFLRSLAKKLT